MALEIFDDGSVGIVDPFYCSRVRSLKKLRPVRRHMTLDIYRIILHRKWCEVSTRNLPEIRAWQQRIGTEGGERAALICLVLMMRIGVTRGGGPALLLVVKKTPLTDVTSSGAVGFKRPATCSARCVA
jgi:hypothetical protein